MKLILESWRRYLKESLEDKPTSIEDIHQLADKLNIPWDDAAEFMRWTKKVTKGKLSGASIYTLTLEERATCSQECEHWYDCYGNNMPFAHRFMATTSLTRKMEPNLDELDKKHPMGYVIRLHILGDVFSVSYVKWWGRQLAKRPSLNIYGYSRHHPFKPIGRAILALREKYPDRFAVRFSNLPSDNMSANSEHVSDEGIICPEQT